METTKNTVSAEQILLYFGSFNPPHYGHMGIGRYLVNNGYCSKVWYVLSPHNPFKTPKELAPEEHRAQMVSLSIEACNMQNIAELSTIEFGLSRPSYTINTLRELKRLYPSTQFLLLIGADNIADFNKWHKSEELKNEATILIYPRPGVAIEHTPQWGKQVEHAAPLFSQSSTQIRQAIKDKSQQLSEYTPSEVVEYIKKNRLYG